MSALDEATGWTHANALDYLPELDAYLFGIRNLHSIVAVDRQSGEPLWIFAGPQSDFAWLGAGELPFHQHQFQWLGDGLLVFDNRGSAESGSRAVEYALDTETLEASQRWEYAPEDAPYCYALGDVTRLDSGNTQVTWSALGAVEHVDTEGEVHWQLQTGLGTALGYADWLKDLQDL